MHEAVMVADTHTSNFSGKSWETGSGTGTLEHRSVSLLDSGTSGVPVDQSENFETGTLEHGAQTEMYVSTGLQTWSTNRPSIFARDVQINDTAYRRLDPDYYAWLRSKMTMARLASNAGRISWEEYEDLRQGFNAMQEWAIRRYGEPMLLEVVRNLDTRTYQPPVAEPDAPTTPTRSDTAARAEILPKVDVIRDQALSLGWTLDQLYATSTGSKFGPCIRGGLPTCLKPGDQIGAVTQQSIEIILASGVRQRFYNLRVDQPWIRRVR
ncbi:MAG: hypothetical protein LC114_03275 [Bryobacterales bacterium]|nr:hypothetical protein [Bryobacterales bacterium]